MKKKIEKLEAKRDHLEKWLAQHKKAQGAVPFVQKNLEMTYWEIDAIANLPDDTKFPYKDLEMPEY